MPGPLSVVPDSAIVDDGVYLLEVSDVDDGETRNEPKRRMFTAQLEIIEPKEFAGMSLWERFTVGNEEDPNGEDPDQLRRSAGARNLRRFYKTMGLDVDNADYDQLADGARGQRIVARVEIETDNDPNSAYYNQQQNRIKRWFQPGEKEIALDPAAPAAPARGKPTARPTARPAARVTEAPPPARPAPRPAAPAPRPAAPAARTTPAAPKPAARPAPATRSAPTLPCVLCVPPVDVPRAEYPEHMEQFHPEGQEYRGDEE